eukprot:2962575-Pyramimonas_sp.AAC.1
MATGNTKFRGVRCMQSARSKSLIRCCVGYSARLACLLQFPLKWIVQVERTPIADSETVCRARVCQNARGSM